MFFPYGQKEIDYLCSKDAKLRKVIDEIGLIERPVETDLFSALLHKIIGQQISVKAQQTIWERMQERFPQMSATSIAQASLQDLQAQGMSLRKAEYIKNIANCIVKGEVTLENIEHMTDEEAIQTLTKFKGVGVWTAEMLLLFCLKRPNILSFHDLGIQRGMRILYRHPKIDKKLFERYKKRLSPYCSVASLYFWAISERATSEAARGK